MLNELIWHIFIINYTKTMHINKLEREKKKLFDFQILLLLKSRFTCKSLISHNYDFKGPKDTREYWF